MSDILKFVGGVDISGADCTVCSTKIPSEIQNFEEKYSFICGLSLHDGCAFQEGKFPSMTMAQLTNLRWLRSNAISTDEIPGSILRATKLEHLSFKGNHVASVPYQIKELTSLQV
jgi:hypothetical protein